ncbi:MAG: NAD(P)/FAD-dependent oxidoreductase [Ilumatobacteraceae bacterium]
MAGPSGDRYDVVVVGGGHNALAAAAYLAGAGRAVVVLERSAALGGAARSERLFPSHGARLSQYAYLVSLLPEQIVDELGLDVTLGRRTVSSYTPVGEGGILVDRADRAGTRAALGVDADAWDELYARTAAFAERVFPTMIEPLRSRDDLRRHVGDDGAWTDFVERPIGELLERELRTDVARGIVLTDALIGTFTSAHDLAANRCFLYHVIGRGTGDWDVPIGGMGTVSAQLAAAARQRGAELVTDADVTAITTDGREATVTLVDGDTVRARHVLAGVAPAVLTRLTTGAAGSRDEWPEGAQVKINMLLSHLPRLRDRGVSPHRAFAGTFHVNEGYEQLARAHRQAASGIVPTVAPCEVYCHSLTDPTILDDALRAAGVQTLTLFALHMPARLFRADPTGALAQARSSILASLDSVLDEPIESCLLAPECIEVVGPLEIEDRLGMPGGHIFHRDLQWPFAEREADVGRWGVETADANVWVCGAGARRGGGVSAIPGRNAAMAVLAADTH